MRKQKQKVTNLQKKLDLAKMAEDRAKEEICKLSLELDEAELALIRKQIDHYEKKGEKDSELFIEERKTLYQMIQSGSSSSALHAQAELDRILQLITEIKEDVY